MLDQSIGEGNGSELEYILCPPKSRRSPGVTPQAQGSRGRLFLQQTSLFTGYCFCAPAFAVSWSLGAACAAFAAPLPSLLRTSGTRAHGHSANLPVSTGWEVEAACGTEV